MADTHEEQLLTTLLDEVARADAALDAAHLEARVLGALSAETTPHPRHTWKRLPVIAAALLAVAIGVTFWPKREVTPPVTPSEVPAVEVPIRETERAARPRAQEQVAPLAADVEAPSAGAPVETADEPAEPQNADNAVEFVPLMPLTPQELSGSFQIVRVQMPNASLGPLRSPLDRPNALVEADVLLGEDGRARAIRVNTNGSIYPWRSR